MELLGRFELPTSSLPNIKSLLSLVVVYFFLSPLILDISRVCGVFYCALPLLAVPCCERFFDDGVGFVSVSKTEQYS